jgi:hypothetical protein
MSASVTNHPAIPPRLLSRGEKLLVGVTLALALLFAVGGVTKLCLPPSTAVQECLGDLVWIRLPLGVLELVVAGLLLRPRTVTLACGLIGLMGVAAVILMAVKGAPLIRLFLPLLVVLVVAVVGYIRRPAAQTASRLGSLLDWYAQEQLDQRRSRR